MREGNAASRAGVSRFMRRAFVLPCLALATLVAIAPSRAQGSPPTAAPQQRDTVTHRLAVDATHIQPAQFLYRLTLQRDSVLTPLGDQRFVITSLDYAGTPALLLARDGMQGVAMTGDSLVVRRDDLRPLHWIDVHGAARVAAEFTADSIFGAMTSPLGKQNVVLPNRGDILVNAMAVDAVVSSLPLAVAWRDSATLLVIDAGGGVLTPATLSVEGEEHVTVPAGDFDCWVVSVEGERGSERLWVGKQSRIVVRAEQVLPQLGGATLARVLVQSDSPALTPSSARLPH